MSVKFTSPSSVTVTGTTYENEPVIKSDGASSDVMEWQASTGTSTVKVREDASNNMDLLVNGVPVTGGASGSTNDGQGLHFDGVAGNIDIASPPDLGAFAVYINNGAGYATTTTTMTVDALSAEIPAGTVLTFREGGEYIVTTTAAASATSIVSTSGLTGAAVADNEGAAYGGANKFSFELIIQADTLTSGSNHYLVDFKTGGRFVFGFESGTNFLSIYDSASWKSFGVKVLDDLKVHHLVCTIDGTAAILYDNGNQVATVTISSSHGIDNCTDARLCSDATSVAHLFDGTLYRTRFWNKTLSAAEVTATYENATVPFADQYGSQTSLVDAAASVFTSGTYSWTAYGSNTLANVSNTLAITYVDNAAGVYNYLRATGDLNQNLVIGKKYRLRVDAKYAGGSSGVALQVHDGGVYVAGGSLTTSLVTYTIDFTANHVSNCFMSLSGLKASNVVTIDNWYVREIGCVADYDLAFANPTQSTMVQDRAGAADGTSSATGVTQVTPIVQVNATAARIGTTAATPADGELLVSGAVGVGTVPDANRMLHVKTTGTVPVQLESTTTYCQIGYKNSVASNCYLLFENTDFKIENGGATRLTIDSAGNVGVGVTPESWYSGFTAIQLSDTGAIWSENIGGESVMAIGENIYMSTGGAYTYLTTDEASSYIQSNGTHSFKVAASGTADAAITWTDALTIASTGLATFSNGIAFSGQTDTSATGAATTSTTLDHYEEGTWTPDVRDLGGNVATCSTADGSFTRIGNRVFIGFNIQLSSIGSMTGSYVLITGLPFNHLATADNGTGTIDYFTNFDTSYSGLTLDTSSTASFLWLTGTPVGGGAAQVYVPVSAISGNERIKGGAQYHI